MVDTVVPDVDHVRFPLVFAFTRKKFAYIFVLDAAHPCNDWVVLRDVRQLRKFSSPSAALSTLLILEDDKQVVLLPRHDFFFPVIVRDVMNVILRF